MRWIDGNPDHGGADGPSQGPSRHRAGRRLLALAATVLLGSSGALAACGGSDPGADPARLTTTATPAPTEAAATTDQTSRTTPEPASTPNPTSGATPEPAPHGTATPRVTPTVLPPHQNSRNAADELEVVPADADPKQRAAGGGGTMDGGGIEVVPGDSDDGPHKPTATPATGPTKLPAEAGAGGKVYTWRDGEHTRRVVLQSGLTVRAGGEITAQDEVVALSGDDAVVEGSGGGPVFRAEGGGGLMTLPGGVLLALDPAWDGEAVADFLERNAIAGERVSELGWLPNGFFIETRPGFPSLELANELAGQQGVVLAAPNWWRELEPQ